MHGLLTINQINREAAEAKAIIKKHEHQPVDWDALRERDAEFFARVAEKRRAREAEEQQCGES